MDKHQSIMNIVELIKNIFGNKTFVGKDYWNDFYAIGLEKGKKLIYISTYNTYKSKPNHYFYECEILLDDPDRPYIVHSKKEDVSKTELLEVMSKFFKIPYNKPNQDEGG